MKYYRSTDDDMNIFNLFNAPPLFAKSYIKIRNPDFGDKPSSARSILRRAKPLISCINFRLHFSIFCAATHTKHSYIIHARHCRIIYFFSRQYCSIRDIECAREDCRRWKRISECVGACFQLEIPSVPTSGWPKSRKGPRRTLLECQKCRG